MPLGYNVEDSAGVRDKLITSQSSMVASIGIASLLSGRELDGLATSFMFVIAAGSAPMRVAAAVTGQGVTITTSSHYFNFEITVRLIGSILLVSITTIVIAVCTSMRLHQQQRKPQMRDVSAQTDQDDATRVAGSEKIFGKCLFTRETISHSTKSNPRQYTRCRICG
eukprot:1788279-Amphidinium_carterae.1